ncbi:unnamed protein product, partial [Brachionus calyciflorus]
PQTYNWVQDKSVTDGPRPGFKKVLSENYISDEVLRKITPCGSRAGLAKYLDEILKPLLDDNEYNKRPKLD